MWQFGSLLINPYITRWTPEKANERREVVISLLSADMLKDRNV